MEVNLETITQANQNLQGVAVKTPLEFHKRLSEENKCNLYLKREDLQLTRSYKIRGAYNKVCQLKNSQKQKGVVCASAGNHGQGVSYACTLNNIEVTVFMPDCTPKQKIKKVESFGNHNLQTVIEGKTFDESCQSALEYSNNKTFIHPFNDPIVISGQGTIAYELLSDLQNIDYVFVPVGGGGLISGISTYFKETNQATKIIGVEPQGAAGMSASFKQKKVISLEKLDTFVDGAAVRTVGDLTYEISRNNVDQILTVPENKIAKTVLDLYNDGIVAELAGALSISALDQLDLRNKNVVCILSGGNNDFNRLVEIQSRAFS